MALLEGGPRLGDLSAVKQPAAPSINSYCTRLTLSLISGSNLIDTFKVAAHVATSSDQAKLIRSNTEFSREFGRAYSALFEGLDEVGTSLKKLHVELGNYCDHEALTARIYELVKDLPTVHNCLGTLVDEIQETSDQLRRQYNHSVVIGNKAMFFKVARFGEALIRYFTEDVDSLNSILGKLNNLKETLAKQ